MLEIKHTPPIKEKNLNRLTANFDIFIAGSDQIWNPAFAYDAYFLDFVDTDKRKISYAASFGIENFSDKDRFLQTVVPNVLIYIHEVNFQKFYQTTTSDSQLAMAFTTEDGLYDLIYQIVGMLYESLKYDEYLVDKYMLCRRIVDGTVTSINLVTNGKTTR